MRKKLSSTQTALERILEALKQELISAADEEIASVAQELRMNLQMPQSAAFAGLTYPARPQLSDFFELEAFRQMRLEDERGHGQRRGSLEHTRSRQAETLSAGAPRQPRRAQRRVTRKKPS